VIAGILQARTSSTRLPGKVLAPVLGRPMIARQLERLARVQRLDRLVVATSTAAGDDTIAALCAELGVPCFRGSLEDVLDRFHAAAGELGADHVVRLTADCPLTDAGLIDRLIEFHLAGDYEYSSNCQRRTFPVGLDAEIVRRDVLDRVWRDAREPGDREHVTLFIRNRPEVFRIGSLENDEDLSALRWTVDEPADLEFVRRVYAELYPRDPAFGWRDVLALVRRRPELADIHRGAGSRHDAAAPRGGNAGGSRDV
jgi:spore coat polysaccharide biosynthesis protein SpsF